MILLLTSRSFKVLFNETGLFPTANVPSCLFGYEQIITFCVIIQNPEVKPSSCWCFLRVPYDQIKKRTFVMNMNSSTFSLSDYYIIYT